MDSRLCFLVAFSAILQFELISAFDCYSCSYTRSSDPTLSYECVDEAANTSITRPCQAPYICKTLALFNQDMTHIRSVTRGCLPIADSCAGEACCNKAGVYPLCEQKCRSDICNGFNPEAWLNQGGGDDNNGGGTGAGSSLTQKNVICYMCVLSFLLSFCV